MENLYVKLSVTIADKEYAYSGESGDASLTVQIPKDILTDIDAGNLFPGLVRAALNNYEATTREAEEATTEEASTEGEDEDA